MTTVNDFKEGGRALCINDLWQQGFYTEGVSYEILGIGPTYIKLFSNNGEDWIPTSELLEDFIPYYGEQPHGIPEATYNVQAQL